MKSYVRSWIGRARRQRGEEVSIPQHAHPQIRQRMRRLAERQAEIERTLEARVTELEASLTEQRRLSLRVAELSDMVAELIGAAARDGSPEFERVLAKYAESV